VLSWMNDFATAYKNYTQVTTATVTDRHDSHPLGSGSGASPLADYGFAANLLECVPTYQHKVASFNAANVWMLEQLAALLAARGAPGDAAAAKAFRADASEMASAVLSLYVHGEGVFKCLYVCDVPLSLRMMLTRHQCSICM
jgi:hypothetical protein